VSQHGPSVDPDTVALVTALDAHLLESTGARQIGMGVAGLIGFLALVVAAVGIHGVIAYTVSCRTREIGVYRALGATPAHVLRLILGWTLKGVAIGLAGALSIMAVVAAVFGSQMRGLLNGLHPLDPVSFGLGSAVLLCVIGIAAFLPARRALGMAPVAALRGE
jgi:putative ABC transport system permease protein